MFFFVDSSSLSNEMTIFLVSFGDQSCRLENKAQIEIRKQTLKICDQGFKANGVIPRKEPTYRRPYKRVVKNARNGEKISFVLGF